MAEAHTRLIEPAGRDITSVLRNPEPPPYRTARYLQRTIGNSAVASLLGGTGRAVPTQGPGSPALRTTPRRSSQAVIQREETSADLLTKLAIPKVRPGPAVKAQQRIIDKLDKDELMPIFAIVNLGAVELTQLPEDDEELIDGAKLVDLVTGYVKDDRSAGVNGYEAVVHAGAESDVIENTLRTMIDAGQIAYLRKSGIPNDDWKILIEVHYYRDRASEQLGFHKDTIGQTLFVNLNYNIDQEVVGPEYVLNPPRHEGHDEQIETSLPPGFVSDLKETREGLGEPGKMMTGVVPAYGYVAFVDEAIHHATPLIGHRTVLGSEVEAYLRRAHADRFEEATNAYKTYKSSFVPSYFAPFSSYFKEGDDKIPTGERQKWLGLLQMSEKSNKAKSYSRPDFLRAGMTPEDIDSLLHEVGKFTSGGKPSGTSTRHGDVTASIPQPKGSKSESFKTPLKGGTKPRLTRQMSELALAKKLPAPLGGKKRSFFRTWVRAVKKPK